MKSSEQVKQLLVKSRDWGCFSLNDIRALSVSPSTITNLVNEGQLIRLGHNKYIHPNNSLTPEERQFTEACSRFDKKAVICGLTALSYHGLYDQPIPKLWVIVPTNKNSGIRTYNLIRTKLSLTEGVDKKRAFSITNIHRTIAEAFYLRDIDPSVAIFCCRKAFKDGKSNLNSVMQIAKRLGISQYLKKYYPALINESWDGE